MCLALAFQFERRVVQDVLHGREKEGEGLSGSGLGLRQADKVVSK